MNFFIKTYGCQMNASDSGYITGSLLEAGFTETAKIEEAGLIIINTCAVRQLPEQKAYSLLGRIKPLKKINPGLKIFVVGCMAQRAGKEIRKRFPIVDLVIGAKDIEKFPEIIRKELANWLINGSSGPGDSRTPKPPLRPVSAFVTIMRGCGNFCSYCVVPFVRGPEVSRSSRDIAGEISGLVERGVKEVTLLGQNVNSYCDPDISGPGTAAVGFPGLLERINGIAGLERIRFMTSHPKDLTESLIVSVANLKKVCEHFHLPLQSGSDEVLKRMNRAYTSRDYLRIVDKIKKYTPAAAVTTDILVGFPGETEEDFKATLNVIRAAGFDSLFAFKYSPRPGTLAAKSEDSVSLAVKEDRLGQVLELGNAISSEKNAKLVNNVYEILVVSGQEDGSYCGSTRANKKVTFPSGIDMVGKIANVKITEVKVNSLSGQLEQVLR